MQRRAIFREIPKSFFWAGAMSSAADRNREMRRRKKLGIIQIDKLEYQRDRLVAALAEDGYIDELENDDDVIRGAVREMIDHFILDMLGPEDISTEDVTA